MDSLELINNKRNFVKKLEVVVKEADKQVEAISMSDDGEYVYIHYPLASIKRVCIACDSNIAIVQDVINAIA